ncbi:MAG TPA: SIS domain-containing protein [Acidimicrobiales bacterium]|nr:SIS domain-containing protein [Acidimicrobiales bacterium]
MDASTTTHSQRFVAETIEILQKTDTEDVERVVEVLRATRERGGRLFFCGSGGGAGHASHAACDFRKLAGIESYSVTDNVSELTARINDEGWDGSYAEWLKVSKLRAGDTLFVFSVGGGDAERGVSVNLVRAVELAKEVGASVVGIVGRDGGTVRRLADASILVPLVDAADVTAQTEGLQALFWHLVVTHPGLCTTTPKWESLTL